VFSFVWSLLSAFSSNLFLSIEMSVASHVGDPMITILYPSTKSSL